MEQSSESWRDNGPYALCPPGAVTRVELWPVPDLGWLDDLEPPPSSNGPTALRGDALLQALAALR
jgi:hypothetical protein